MCTRYALKLAGLVRLARELGVDPAQLAAIAKRDRYNIAPGSTVTALRTGTGADASGRPEIAALHWGLVPSWTRERNGTPLVNARAETVAEKPSFRGAWHAGRRCVLPASGFIEWEKAGRDRLPWWFTDSSADPADPDENDPPPLALAAVWDRWEDPHDGVVVESCAVLTTTPNAAVGRIHHRMPALLDAAAARVWLDPHQTPPAAAALLQPFPAARLRATALDTRINSSAHDDPACLAPRPPDRHSNLQFEFGLES